MLEQGVKGFHVIEHSECENCEKGEDWNWMKGRSDVKHICWDMETILKTETGPKSFPLPLNCEFHKIS
jgi:hypothetical protein